MGKSQSREEEVMQEAYVVHGAPGVYDLEGLRAAERKNFVLQPAPVIHPEPPTLGRRRSRSLYSLHSNDTMASSKWKAGFSAKDLLEKKVYYLGRFQTQAMTKTALGNLRTVIRQSKMKKTKIKMSPLGITFGTKTGGVLTQDKVAHRFLDIQLMELLEPDSMNKDVLLCVSRVNNSISIPSGNTDVIYTQNYEINAFYMEPRDAIAFQYAFNDFKRRDPLVAVENDRGSVIRTRSTSTVARDVVDSGPPKWTSAVPDPRSWVVSRRDERDVRVGNVDTYKQSRNTAYVVDNTIDRRRINSFHSHDTNKPSSPRYVYDGALTNERRTKHRHTATTADMPGASGPVSPSGVHSLTTKVYFDDNDGPAMADVECQVKPKTSTKKNEGGNTTVESSTTIEKHSKSSSASSHRQGRSSKNRNESVKRRIKNLSKEMEKLKSMVDSSDDEVHTLNAQVDSSSSSSESVVRANGTLKRSGDSRMDTHAGTINTKAGVVDVVVENNAPKTATKQRQYTKTTAEVRRTTNGRVDAHAGTINTKAGTVDVVVDSRNAAKDRHLSRSSEPANRSNHSGQRLLSQSSSNYSTNTRNRTQTRVSRTNGSTSGTGERIVYYRPVTPEPALTWIPETSSAVHARSRSTEPPRTGTKMRQAAWVYQ